MKKVLLGIFGLGLLAVCGFEIFRRRKACNTMEAVWVSTIPVDEGKEEKSVTEMTNDVDQAISEMDIEDILAEATNIMTIDEKADEILKEGKEVLDKANRMLGDSEENKRKEEELQKKIKEIEEKEKKRNEEKLNADIQKAIERKNFTDMFRLFDRKYACGPIGITAADAFGSALKDGLITDEIYQEAHKRYEKLWFYSRE